MERWQGRIDAQLYNIDKTLSNQSKKIETVETDIHNLHLKVEQLATKMVIYSALGATLGSALLSVIIGLIFKYSHG